jgi:ParB family chromosome partitioning protein
MAKATTTSNSTPTRVPDLAAGLAAGTVTIEAIDPQTAQLDPNIRTNPILPAGFVDSIRAEGVREPVLARRGEDGTVFVYDGQRRLLAAREAGIPALLAVFGVADTTGTASGRIMDQLRTFARADLALSDRLAAYEALTLDGITVERIAKSAGADKGEVEAALTVAKSEVAREALGYGQESLERLLLIAEFEDDEDAVAEINDADDDDLAYVAQRFRDERLIDAHRAEVRATFEAEGLPLIDEQADYAQLHRLTDAAEDDTDRPPVDPDAHDGCPGHALLLRVWGLRPEDQETTEVCTQPDLHQPRWNYSSPVQQPTTEPTEDEVEGEAERKRVERRRLIANNKAWDAAETVRREWITAFMARKKLPTDAAPFVAITLTRFMWDFNNDHGTYAGTFLSIERWNGREIMASQVDEAPTRAGHVNLALALSARENATSRESWRTPSDDAKAYLLQLEKWGHHLTDVERIAAGYPEDPDIESDGVAEVEISVTDTPKDTLRALLAS